MSDPFSQPEGPYPREKERPFSTTDFAAIFFVEKRGVGPFPRMCSREC